MGLCVLPDIFVEAPARPGESVAAMLVSSSLSVLVFSSTSGIEKNGGVGAYRSLILSVSLLIGSEIDGGVGERGVGGLTVFETAALR